MEHGAIDWTIAIKIFTSSSNMRPFTTLSSSTKVEISVDKISYRCDSICWKARSSHEFVGHRHPIVIKGTAPQLMRMFSCNSSDKWRNKNCCCLRNGCAIKLDNLCTQTSRAVMAIDISNVWNHFTTKFLCRLVTSALCCIWVWHNNYYTVYETCAFSLVCDF